MQKSLVRKGLVVGIIVLFVGASVIPSISGYDKNIENTDYVIDKNETLNMKNDDYNNLIRQVIESGVISTDDWLEQDKLLASDGSANNHFSSSVSMDGDYAIIGAYHDDDNGNFSGSAYIFTRSGSTWSEQAKLLAIDGQEGDEFGYSVSIDGDYAIVGARFEDYNGEDSGSAYIFTRSGSTWTHQAKLTAITGEADDEFGCSVSINGEWAIVGARFDDDNGVDSGSAYMFKRYGSVWIHEEKLIALDGQTGDEFGCSVSIDGDYAIIGAYLDDDIVTDSGSAYIFAYTGYTWLQQAILLAADGEDYDYFGKSVSINGDYAIIGAYGDDDNGDRSGSAYIFTRSGSTWNEQAKILASDGELIDYFGLSVSIDEDYAIIGAYHDDDNGDWSGSAYIFTRSGSTWNEQAKLLASDGAAFDEFGYSVSIDGDYAIIGARWDDDNGVGSGSAYIYIKGLIPDLDCSGTLNWTGVTPGSIVTGSFTVENIGEPDSLLDWEINSFPDWGTWSFDPDGGTGLTGYIIVEVEVVAPDEQEETFTGEIKIINSENLSDFCIIDVSLATPVNQQGDYTITAKAKDIFDAESDWGELEVEMPVNQQVTNSLLQMILERFPNAFPILRYLLGL